MKTCKRLVTLLTVTALLLGLCLTGTLGASAANTANGAYYGTMTFDAEWNASLTYDATTPATVSGTTLSRTVGSGSSSVPALAFMVVTFSEATTVQKITMTLASGSSFPTNFKVQYRPTSVSNATDLTANDGWVGLQGISDATEVTCIASVNGGVAELAFAVPPTCNAIMFQATEESGAPWNITTVEVTATGSATPSNPTTPSTPSTPDDDDTPSDGAVNVGYIKKIGGTKKGVAASMYAGNPEKLLEVNASWYYNWGYSGRSIPGMTYIPMSWAPQTVTDHFDEIVSGNYTAILGPNEPDMGYDAGGCNTTVENALNFWPHMMNLGEDIMLGSPAVTVDYNWLRNFMTQATQKGYRVDFIPFHCYQQMSNASSQASGLKSLITSLYDEYQRPLWLTEFGNIFSGSSADTVNYVNTVMPMLESLGYVAKYSWFVDDYGGGSVPSEGANSRLFANGALTATGTAYKNIVTREALTIDYFTVTDEGIQVQVSGGSGSYIYGASGLPSGASIDSTTGFITCPKSLQGSISNMRITVADSAGQSNYRTLTAATLGDVETDPITPPSTTPSTAPSTAPSTTPSTAPSTAPSTTPSETPSEDPTEDPSVTFGDVDGNEVINAIDATRVLLYTVDKIELDETQRTAADVNEDGKINAVDATRILLHVVGKKPIG